MIYAANLKCNHTRDSFIEYANTLNAELSDERVMIFPPASAFIGGLNKFIQGAQNFYPCQSGSFTGEIGADMLDEFGIRAVMIGHSERRFLGENDQLLQSKFDFAKRRGWDIVFCVGEDEAVHTSGKAKEFIKSELSIIDIEYENLIIAYEPVWAIGTGKTASSEVISDILSFITKYTSAPLLYGGSVNDKTIDEIRKIECCNGVLVGTFSWDAKNFLKLIKPS